jgi:hypothetical protein
LNIIKSVSKFIFTGVGGEKFNSRTTTVGADEFSCAYYFLNGNKWTRLREVEYDTRAEVGDKIDLILNLTSSYGTVEYLKNDISMGIAFSGVKKLGKLWFAVSSMSSTDRFSISY